MPPHGLQYMIMCRKHFSDFIAEHPCFSSRTSRQQPGGLHLSGIGFFSAYQSL